MMNRSPLRSLPMVFLPALALLLACNSNGDNNNVRPIRASVSTPNPVPAGPAAYLRVAASDDPDDDLVPVEIVLNPGGAPLTFDAYNVEILPTDPNNPGILRDGVQQMVFDDVHGSTPFGTCGGGCAVCFTTCCSDNNSFQLRVSNVTSPGCLPPTATSETVLGLMTVFTRTPGTTHLGFRAVPNATGDCEILLQNAEAPVTFDDRGAIFTASR
jgi:hypothetical protein